MSGGHIYDQQVQTNNQSIYQRRPTQGELDYAKHAQINRPTQGELENNVYTKHVQIDPSL